MEARSKTITVDVGGAKYQVRRMTPVVGSYIWQRLQLGAYKGAQAMLKSGMVAERSPEEVKAIDVVTVQDRLRALCGGAFMCMDYADFEFVQRECVKVLARVEPNAGIDMPVPLMTDDGRWVLQDVYEDPALVTRLMVEAVVFNMESFLEERNGVTMA